MSLDIQCDVCVCDMEEPGGLIFSPPDADGRVIKMHVCLECWDDDTGTREARKLMIEARKLRQGLFDTVQRLYDEGLVKHGVHGHHGCAACWMHDCYGFEAKP